MNKILKKLTAFLLVTFLCVLSMQIPVYAAGANVTIAVSQSSLKIGDTISVTINISTEGAIGSYSMPVSYNSAVLDYTGGSGSGGGGTVLIAGYGDGSQTRLSATLNFKAIGNGTSTISTSGGEAYSWDESVLGISHAGATVTVSAPQAPSEGNNNNNNGGNGSTDAPLTGSGDNSLKSLEISPGTLNPAFQSGTTSYTVELPEDTKSIVVSAIPNDSKATVAVSHNNDLEPGANKTYIVVTAENGTQKTYVLNVNCGEVEEEQEIPPVIIDGKEYNFATAAQMEGVTVPEAFETGEEDYEEGKITVYISPNQRLQIAYLFDGDGTGQWFIYNKEQKTFIPYVEHLAAANRYVVMIPDESVLVPANYTPTEIDIQGQKVTAYIKDGNTEFVLVYAMNLEGEIGFYLYDTTEETYQRYVEPEVVSQEPEVIEPEVPVTPLVTEDEKLRNLRGVLYVLSGISVLLLGFVIGISIYWKKKLMDIREESDKK